jgi:hypothetical protein
MSYINLIFRILIIIACFYAVTIQVMRIIWLYRPEFIKGSSLYKHKEPSKYDQTLYFIGMLVILAYTIYSMAIKMF